MFRPAAWLALCTVVAAGGCLRKPPGAQHPSVETTRSALEEAQAGQQPSDQSFYVLGRSLYDRCGERVIRRGVNKMVIPAQARRAPAHTALRRGRTGTAPTISSV